MSENCLSTFRIQAEQEQKTFQVSIQLEDPAVLGDASQLDGILNNLLSNAPQIYHRRGSGFGHSHPDRPPGEKQL